LAKNGSENPAIARMTLDPLSGTLSHLESSMIASFRDDWLRAFFVDDVRSKRIPPALESRLFRKLQMIDDATTDQDLRVPPSNHFEKLRGDLDGLHSIRVNKQWRLIFRWNGSQGEASGLYLDDHRYQ
jgi:toxin HigB-1